MEVLTRASNLKPDISQLKRTHSSHLSYSPLLVGYTMRSAKRVSRGGGGDWGGGGGREDKGRGDDHLQNVEKKRQKVRGKWESL